jgi:SAM-dependent methyltransferase
LVRVLSLDNPYLTYFAALPPACRRDATRPVDTSELGAPQWLQFKAAVAAHFAWAVPTAAAIDAIRRQTDRVIEIGCGSGYWAWLMKQRGIDVVAVDTMPRAWAWHEILLQGHEVVVEHPERALFLCWPPWGTRMAFDTLSAYRGDLVIYVGEWMGGSAEAHFFSLLSTAFEVVDAVDIPQWVMRTDRLTLHRRRRTDIQG